MQRIIAALLFLTIVIGIVCFLHSQVYPNTSHQEGFMPQTVQISDRQCGVDFPSCAEGEQCLNGYCASNSPPVQDSETDLPLRPPVFSPQ